MRGERSFYNGRTGRAEARLTRVGIGKRGEVAVWQSYSEGNGPNHYPDTDEGYAAALADYEARVARLQAGEATC